MISNNIFIANSYLVLILPLALISGPFIPDLIVVLSSIILFLYADRKNFYEICKEKLILLFIIFWIIAVLSSLFSNDVIFSLRSSFFYIRFIFLIIVIYFFLKNFTSLQKKYFKLLIFIFFLIFIDASFQKYFGFNIFGFQMYHEVRISSFFRDELIMGSYLVKFYPILIALTHLFCTKNFKKVFYLLSFITLISVFLSAEKSAAAIFLMEYLLISFILIKDYKNKIYSLVIPVALLLVLLKSFPGHKQRIFDQLVANSNNFKTIYSNMHQAHYVAGYKIFIDNKTIGIGPKMFRVHCNYPKYLDKNTAIDYGAKVSYYSCSTHPHNFSIQILAETGIFGFITYLSIYFIFLKDFIILIFKKEKNKYYVPFYCCVLLNLLYLNPLFPSGNFFNNWLAIIYSIPIGFYLYFKHKECEKI